MEKKLIIFEYLSSQIFKEKFVYSSKLKEGLNIVNHLCKDFLEVGKLDEIFVIRNEKLPKLKIKEVKYLESSLSKNWFDLLSNLNPNIFDLILIAPEDDLILNKLIGKLKKLKINTLNCNFSSLKKLSSKILCFNFLKKNKIPCIDSFQNINLILKNKQYIIKPIFGAGSKNVFLIKNYEELLEKIKKIKFPYLIQYYYNFKVGSVGVLFFNGKNKIISCNEHIIRKRRNCLSQIGSIIGGLEKNKNEFKKITDKISFSCEGLFGYIGLDVIFDGINWSVLEINPRFTSSYIGIKSVYKKKVIIDTVNLYTKQCLQNVEERKQSKLKVKKLIF